MVNPELSARSLRGWVTRMTRNYHNALGGQWTVWCPESEQPPVVRYMTEKQARAVARAMANRHPLQHFIVCQCKDVFMVGGYSVDGVQDPGSPRGTDDISHHGALRRSQ